MATHSISHGTSIERDIGIAKKTWKDLKAAAAPESEITAAKEKYKALKLKGTEQQAAKTKASKQDTTKYEKAIRKKLKNIEMLKAKVARWTTQKPNTEQKNKLSREKDLIQELIKITRVPYIPSGVNADGNIIATSTTTAGKGKNTDYCQRFQRGKCPNEDCPYLHEIRPSTQKKVVVAMGKKRKFVEDEDEVEEKDGEADLKAQWKKLKADGADANVIKAAKKRYKDSKL